MELSEIKIFQILKEWRTIGARTARVADAMNIGDNYAMKLKEGEFFLASIAIHSQVLEHLVRCLLEGYASRKRFLQVVGETDRFASVDISNLSDKTLGTYTRILNKFEFTGKQDLIELLEEFNTLRNQCVHRAFDSKKKKDFYEKKSMEYMKGDSLKKIEQLLSSAFDELAKENLVITQHHTPPEWHQPSPPEVKPTDAVEG